LSPRRVTARGIANFARSWPQERAAVRQAQEFCRRQPAEIRICWDLDNTLVDSGTLMGQGRRLDQAIVEAYPVANMLGFYEAMRARLPGAENFILSARAISMRDGTFEWVKRHRLQSAAAVCLVPRVTAKPRIWRRLAADAQLVIVDDLSFNHEQQTVSLYHQLISQAQTIAAVYIGLDEIAGIATDPAAIAPLVERTVQAVTPSRSGPVKRSSSQTAAR
jgi:hypothetical protein